MQGFAAISANNGWAMALAGACIVMTGLTTLSIIISQLHRIIQFFEKGSQPEKVVVPAEPEPIPSFEAEADVLEDLDATAKHYQALTTELGDDFGLIQLHRLLVEKNLPHPHITLRELRDAGYLIPAGEGNFSWDNN